MPRFSIKDLILITTLASTVFAMFYLSIGTKPEGAILVPAVMWYGLLGFMIYREGR